MFAGLTELTQRLVEVAPDRVEMYLAARHFHFALWKWQRISDRESLGFLRRVLLETGLAEVNPDASWIVNRDAETYRKFLDLHDNYTKMGREALGGHVSARHPSRSFDGGSGNNTAAYEINRASIVAAGSGLSLLLPLDITLRNFLYEPFRSPRLAGYKSEAAGSALKGAEIWTINRFGADLPGENDFNPIAQLEEGLSEGAISGSLCSSVSRRTFEFLEHNRPADGRGAALVCAVALGLLIDALASRACFPNGMDFTYVDMREGWGPDVLALVLDLLRDPANRTNATPALIERKDKLADLSNRVVAHLEDRSLSPDVDVELIHVLPELADLFKAVGFELRGMKSDVRLVETFHFIGNELWRWHFFLSDLASWNSTAGMQRRASHEAATVRKWLDRPWGILRIDDMYCSLAEGFEDAATGESPRLLTPLLPLLKGGVDRLVKEELADFRDAHARIDWLIEQRCRLVDLRQSINFVTYTGEDDELTSYRDLADLLIELLTLWFYDQSEEERRMIVKKEFKPLLETMRSGAWLKTLQSGNQTPLTRRQLKVLEGYRAAPKDTIESLFDFRDGKGLFERVDVFPLEEFWFWPKT